MAFSGLITSFIRPSVTVTSWVESDNASFPVPCPPITERLRFAIFVTSAINAINTIFYICPTLMLLT